MSHATPKPTRVLVVDDEPNVRLVFRTTLEAAGYEVDESPDGLDALDRVRRRPFDLLLLDLRMPRLEGMETLRRLREQGSNVPVVVVTAHGGIPDVVEAVKLGAVDFLPKPVSPETLRNVVGRAAASAPARAAKADAPTTGLGLEALDRAREALRQGHFDEADFFVRVAATGGADAEDAKRLGDEIRAARSRRGLNPYRLLGEFTWG